MTPPVAVKPVPSPPPNANPVAPPPKPAKPTNGFSFLNQLFNIVITSYQAADVALAMI
jgi:hypothetical protein